MFVKVFRSWYGLLKKWKGTKKTAEDFKKSYYGLLQDDKVFPGTDEFWKLVGTLKDM